MIVSWTLIGLRLKLSLLLVFILSPELPVTSFFERRENLQTLLDVIFFYRNKYSSFTVIKILILLRYRNNMTRCYFHDSNLRLSLNSEEQCKKSNKADQVPTVRRPRPWKTHDTQRYRMRTQTVVRRMPNKVAGQIYIQSKKIWKNMRRLNQSI